MDTNALVETAQQGGRELITRLNASGFPITSAFWWLTPLNKEWQLVIASPEVLPGQLRAAYAKVDSALSALTPKPPFGLNDVVLVPPNEPLVEAIRRGFRAGPGSLWHISNTTVNNVFIESAYLYQS
jgi:hypothetical protein